MHHTPFPGIAGYVATKAAVAAYTRNWARDLGPRNIRANVIQPGPIDTGMTPTDGPVADMLKAHLAIARYGKANEVAAAVGSVQKRASSPAQPWPSMGTYPPDHSLQYCIERTTTGTIDVRRRSDPGL